MKEADVFRVTMRRHGREVTPAAPPALTGNHQPCVHVRSRHLRVARVHNDRDSRCPKARILARAGDFLGKGRR